MYVCMYVCSKGRLFFWESDGMYVCMYVCMHACMYECIDAGMQRSMYVARGVYFSGKYMGCMYICMQQSMYVTKGISFSENHMGCIYVCMYVCSQGRLFFWESDGMYVCNWPSAHRRSLTNNQGCMQQSMYVSGVGTLKKLSEIDVAKYVCNIVARLKSLAYHLPLLATLCSASKNSKYVIYWNWVYVCVKTNLCQLFFGFAPFPKLLRIVVQRCCCLYL